MRTQKELKELYKEELKKVWEQEHMQEFCLKEVSYLVEDNGLLIAIDKPDIQKDFCFGYGYSGLATQEQVNGAYDEMRRAENDTNYFMEKNLHNLNKYIETLEEIAEEMRNAENCSPRYLVELGQYCSAKDGCKIRTWGILDTYNFSPDGKEIATLQMVEKLIEGHKEAKVRFEKRLNTYLKRYGLTKLNTWTYLVD